MIENDNDPILIPQEVIKPPHFFIGVFAGDLITTNVVQVQVEESVCIEGQVPPEPTPTVYSQLIDTVESERVLSEKVQKI